MIRIKGKAYKEIILMDKKNNIIATIDDKGKVTENNGVKVILVPNKS